MSFLNTVVLVKTSGGSGDIVTAIVDGPTNRKTLRSSADSLTVLSIAHQESKENGVIPTQRSNVRIETSKEVEDSGTFAVGYVQFTMSIPKGIFSVSDTKALVAQLINFLDQGDSSSPEPVVDSGTDLGPVDRLYAGEP